MYKQLNCTQIENIDETNSLCKIAFTYLLTYLFTPWSKVFLEKLTGSLLVKKFPHFMEPGSSLLHSQVPATCQYPEPAHSTPFPTSHFLKIHLNIIYPPIYA